MITDDAYPGCREIEATYGFDDSQIDLRNIRANAVRRAFAEFPEAKGAVVARSGNVWDNVNGEPVLRTVVTVLVQLPRNS